MRTLVVYATKHGATKKIAEGIAEGMGNAVLYDVCKDGEVALGDYECVVLGSSLTAGRIRKDMKNFIGKHADELRGKRFGIFLSGLQESGTEEYFEQNFSQELLDKAAEKAFLGGIFDPGKCGFMERVLIKAAAKLDVYTSTIDNERVASFARAMLNM